MTKLLKIENFENKKKNFKIGLLNLKKKRPTRQHHRKLCTRFTRSRIKILHPKNTTPKKYAIHLRRHPKSTPEL